MPKEDFVFRAGVRRQTCHEEDRGEGGKPGQVAWRFRGLSVDDGADAWKEEVDKMDREYKERLQPELDKVNARLQGPPLTIVHEDLNAWAVNFFAGKSGGYMGCADPKRCPLVLGFTWPPHDSMGELDDGRMGMRMLSPTGMPSDTAFCAIMKIRSVLSDEGPQHFGEMLADDQLERALWSSMDISSADIEGNTVHVLTGVSDGSRRLLGAKTFLHVVLPFLVDNTSIWVDGPEGKGVYASALLRDAISIAADDFTGFSFDALRAAMIVSDPRLSGTIGEGVHAVNYGAKNNKQFLAAICHGACIFPKTGVLIVAGHSSCYLSRRPEEMSNKCHWQSLIIIWWRANRLSIERKLPSFDESEWGGMGEGVAELRAEFRAAKVSRLNDARSSGAHGEGIKASREEGGKTW
ncbi:hypothetical protein T484DRAFT_1850034, partial [Baffinella frigidus]